MPDSQGFLTIPKDMIAPGDEDEEDVNDPDAMLFQEYCHACARGCPSRLRLKSCSAGRTGSSFCVYICGQVEAIAKLRNGNGAAYSLAQAGTRFRNSASSGAGNGNDAAVNVIPATLTPYW